MNKIKNFLFLPLIVMAGFFLNAQNSLDLQRYSGYSIIGTARTIGVGGAASAIGADFGSVSLNPASLAFYRKSDLGFTAGFRNFNTQTNHIGNLNNASTANFGFSNLHFVFADASGGESDKLKGWAFGIGFNQLDNYYRKTEASAFNKYNSIGDYYVLLAGNTSANNLQESSLPFLAYDTYYIDTINSIANAWVPVVDGNMQQNYSRKETGRLNSWEFNLGFNVNDKLYIGAGLGVLDVKYTSSEVLREIDTQNLYDTLYANFDRIDIASFEQRYRFSTSGIGVNGKLGVIFRPVDAFRIGLGLQTPTTFNLKDTYQVGMTMTQDGGTQYPKEGPEGLYQYRLRTPFRVTLGAVGFIEKTGLISFDLDYIDYSRSSLIDNFNTSTFTVANRAVSQLGNSSAINFRLGGELRNNQYYFRGGYANFASFWNAEGEKYDDLSTYEATTGTFQVKNYKSNRQCFTIGTGYREEEIYLDFAIIYQIDHLKYNLYEMPVNAPILGWGVSPVILQKRTQIGMIFTFGFRF